MGRIRAKKRGMKGSCKRLDGWDTIYKRSVSGTDSALTLRPHLVLGEPKTCSILRDLVSLVPGEWSRRWAESNR